MTFGQLTPQFLSSNPDAAPTLVSAVFPEVACLASQPHYDGVVAQPVCHGQDFKLRSAVDAMLSSLKGSWVLVSEVQDQTLSSRQHFHANFVMHLCIELLEPHFDAVSVAIHVLGSRVLQWLSVHGSCEPQLIQLDDSMLDIIENVEKRPTVQAESTLSPKPRISDVACALQPARSLGRTDVASKLLSPNPNAAPMLVSALVREVARLASHPRGTRVVSELVCHCSGLKLRSDVDVPLSWLKGPLVLLHNDCLDCRVAQAALREVASETQQCSVLESQGQRLSVCQNLRANVDRLAYRMPSSAAFIVRSASKEPDVLEHRFCHESGSLAARRDANGDFLMCMPTPSRANAPAMRRLANPTDMPGPLRLRLTIGLPRIALLRELAHRRKTPDQRKDTNPDTLLPCFSAGLLCL